MKRYLRRPLQAGDRFRLQGAEWEVLRVGSCSATVRPVERDRRVIMGDGQEIIAEFDAPRKPVTISAMSLVEEI